MGGGRREFKHVDERLITGSLGVGERRVLVIEGALAVQGGGARGYSKNR